MANCFKRRIIGVDEFLMNINNIGTLQHRLDYYKKGKYGVLQINPITLAPLFF
jgi:hypothetical protein